VQPLRVALLADPDDDAAGEWAARTGAVLLHRGRELLALRPASRPAVVHVRRAAAGLDRAVGACVLAGVRAVLASPRGDPPATLPTLERRVHRWLFTSDAAARPWRDAGIAPGRMACVVDDADLPRALRALWSESAAMAGTLPVWMP
jgi:hypothetical protein